jgi:hypothetical protein
LFQATPYSKTQKKVVELPGGVQTVASSEVTYIGGMNVLDNNQVTDLSIAGLMVR